MDTLEGVMLIPPDRGQLLGRAVWKVSNMLEFPLRAQRAKLCEYETDFLATVSLRHSRSKRNRERAPEQPELYEAHQ
jgi:hypothetical protein